MGAKRLNSNFPELTLLPWCYLTATAFVLAYTLISALDLPYVLAAIFVHFLVACMAGSLHIRALGGAIVLAAGGWMLRDREASILFLVTSSLVPWAEEVCFRGVIFRFLHAKMGGWRAAYFTSVVFMLCHSQLQGLLMLRPSLHLGAFVLSYACCALVAKTKMIYLAVALHGIANMSVALLPHLPVYLRNMFIVFYG